MNSDSFIIEGLAGQKTLSGEVTIHGAKNAALKAMAAAVLFDGPVRLHNIPENADTGTLTTILAKLGVTVKREGDSLTIDPSAITSGNIDPTLAGSMRASVVLTGPLLGRLKRATFPAPGGCVIGARPIDLFIKGYEAMGATVTESTEDSIYTISAGDSLVGTTIEFEKISVGATETLMMAAIMAEGTTTLKNCAREPEIGNVAEWLNAGGAKIKGIGTDTLIIEGNGGKLLSAATAEYTAIPDRIETGSFLLLGALAAKDLKIKNCRPDHLEMLITLLQKSGVPIATDSNSITISNNTKPNSVFKSFDFETREYPGFATDVQAPAVVFLTQATGKSKVSENIFEGRFKYSKDLVSMGAKIKEVSASNIEIEGPTDLAASKSELNALDIRAGFAVVTAALVGKGTFTIGNVRLIDRGYEKLEEQLAKLGARVRRIK